MTRFDADIKELVCYIDVVIKLNVALIFIYVSGIKNPL